MNFALALIPAPYRILALIILAGVLVAFGFVKGLQYEGQKFDAYKDEQEKAVLEAKLVSAQKTANLLSDAQVLEGVKNAEVKAIDARLRAALGELQKRPDRAPGFTPGTSVGDGGCAPSQLYRADAEVALQLATDADKLRVAYQACQAQYNKVRDSINGKQ